MHVLAFIQEQQSFAHVGTRRSESLQTLHNLQQLFAQGALCQQSGRVLAETPRARPLHPLLLSLSLLLPLEGFLASPLTAAPASQKTTLVVQQGSPTQEGVFKSRDLKVRFRLIVGIGALLLTVFAQTDTAEDLDRVELRLVVERSENVLCSVAALYTLWESSTA